MTDDDKNFAPILILLGCTAVFVLGLTILVSSSAEEQTVVYCIEQPSACKTKYDYYKLEARK